jgi:biopolymer transport protein ExbD
MKFRRKSRGDSPEPDMTPMIDMVFQLIAFFMVLLNFGEGEVDARIKLPSSELAKPPEAPLVSPLVLQLTDDDKVIFAGDTLAISAMERPLITERRFIELKGEKVADATVILRADADAKTGIVQEVIQMCQDNGFEKFALRVKQELEELN